MKKIKAHSLTGRITPKLMRQAFRKVKQNRGAAGVDKVSVEMFAKNLDENLDALMRDLKSGTFRTRPLRRVLIPKGPGTTKLRPLGIPVVRDRVAQEVLRRLLAPIFEPQFHENSFGFIRGRNCHQALERALEYHTEGDRVVLDADIQGFFDTIPKNRLLDIVREKISDRRVLGLIKQFLDQGIMDNLKTWTPETGVPQGAVLSPVLSNAYLNPLDHLMAEAGFQMVRYADDFVILCRTPEEAEAALAMVRTWVEEQGLILHPEKTHIVDSREKSFSFLGYSFRGNMRFPREKSLRKFRDRIRELTPRKSGKSMEEIIRRLNRMTRGWFGYFRHCHWSIFREYDQMIRRRLRRVLLKRHRRNPKRLPRNQRWPDDYFTDRGYASLNVSHMRFVQSTGTY